MGQYAHHPDQSREDLFRAYCVHYSEVVNAEGLHLKPYLDESLPVFSQLPVEVQKLALSAIETDIEIFHSVKNDGNRLRDSAKHLWRFLKNFDLVPEPDIFEKITTGDVVEIYLVDANGQRQVFRNLRFLECISFTIEQLFGMDWRVATARDAESTQAILNAAIDLMTGKVTSTLPLAIPRHIVKEVGSPGLHTLTIQMKFLSPVRRQGRVVGAIATNHCEVIR